MPGGLPPIDFLLLTVFVLIAANGGRRGFIKEAAMILGVVIDGVVASHVGPLVADLFWRDDTSPSSTVLASLVVLIVVFILVAVGVSLVKPVLRSFTMRSINVLAGIGLGSVEATLLLGTVATVALRFRILDEETSRVSFFFAQTLLGLKHYLPGDTISMAKMVSIAVLKLPS
jgi:uncharacterized membrane protein required for colicin V production